MQLYVSGTPPSSRPGFEGASTPSDAVWWETPYGRWRLAAEKEAMRRFPDFELVGTTLELSGLLIGWRGWIESSLEGGDRYLVRVIYPKEFPDQPPIVLIPEPEFPSCVPHLLDGNRPCLYRPMQGPRHGYDPARTTAATLVAWTVLWINAYETWRTTEVWPGKAE